MAVLVLPSELLKKYSKWDISNDIGLACVVSYKALIEFEFWDVVIVFVLICLKV